MLSFESAHRGDSNEYKQYTIFNTKKENHPKLSLISSYGIFSNGLKYEFERTVVNKPLKVDCTWNRFCNCTSCSKSSLFQPAVDTLRNMAKPFLSSFMTSLYFILSREFSAYQVIFTTVYPID